MRPKPVSATPEKASETHERIADEAELRAGSDRAFGFVFAVVFVIIALWPLLTAPRDPVRLWALAVAAMFVVSALFWTTPLKPLNRLWFRFGLLLHKIISPVVMGLLFYTTVAPIGLFMRLMGKDLLRLRWQRDAATYWIERTPPGPAPETMRNQF